jgi:CBS domain-containing membrane protein
MSLPAWLEAFIPPPTHASHKLRLTAVAGVFIGIGITALICGGIRMDLALKLWLMAPLGATAVQVFAVPSAPASQPWPVIGGHAVSAIAGLVCFHLFGETSVAAGSAVALATLLMLYTRSLHPSGGGTALFIVLSQTGDWRFIVFPVVTNAVCLVAAATAYHRMTGHAYPQRYGETAQGF